MYRIDNWINGGSGWIVELIESQYINISTYRPLSGSSYVQLPAELKSPKKGLINIKNNDQKYFLWCHVRHINPVKIHPQRIRQIDKELVNDLGYDRIEFPVREKDFSKIETKNNIHINVFGHENRLESNFIEIALRHVCSPVHLLHILKTPFYKNTYGRLLLYCLPYIILTKQPGECLKKICN